jgi:HEAT repeat protein
MKGSSLAIVTALAVWGSSSHGAEADVRAALGDPTRAEAEATWRAMGEGAVGPLSRIAESKRTPMPQRLRAVRAMGWVEGAGAVAALRKLASSAGVDAAVRAEAAAALQNRVEEDAAPLTALLGSQNVQVRETAVRAVVRVGGDEAKGRLEERVGEEPVVAVRELIQRGLTTLEP